MIFGSSNQYSLTEGIHLFPTLLLIKSFSKHHFGPFLNDSFTGEKRNELIAMFGSVMSVTVKLL